MAIRKSRYVYRRRTDEDSDALQTLSYSSIDGYVSAIASLWQTQRALGNNPYDAPRGQLVKALLENQLRQETKRRRAQYVDRGALTIHDGYNAETFARVVRSCWQDSKASGVIQARSAQSVLSGLRTASDLLLAHNMLLRSETRRDVQLPDLFSLQLHNEGPSPCTAVVMLINQGKRNQFGKMEYGCVVRHRDARICTVAHLAAYLVYRW